MDVTYKTHPPLAGIVGLGITLNTTNPNKLIELSSVLLRTLPKLTDEGKAFFHLFTTIAPLTKSNLTGLRGYAYWPVAKTLLLLLVHPNSLDATATNNTLAPFWEWIANDDETQVRSYGNLYPSFFAFFEAWSADISIAIPTVLSSRLISREALLTKSDELAQYVIGDQKGIVAEINIGMNVSAIDL